MEKTSRPRKDSHRIRFNASQSSEALIPLWNLGQPAGHTLLMQEAAALIRR